MLEPWNDASLLPPPVHTFLSHRKVDIQELRAICRNIIKVLSNQSPLHKESAILSRFAYKYDKKFRSDIGYRHFKKVNVALRRYLGLNLLKDIENFSDTLPAEDEKYLPTKQMLQYVMIRLITFAKIMMRVCVCSKQASVFYLDRIKSGESYWMSLMPYAVLSRVWSLCGVLLRHTCAWYARLSPWLGKLQLKGLDFLPDNYNLPEDLEDWLDMKNIDCFGRFEWAPDKHLSLHQSLLAEDDNDDNPDSFIDYVNRLNDEDESEGLQISSNLTFNNIPSPTEIQVHQTQSTDTGESISRDSLKAELYSQLKSTEILNADKGKTISREHFKVPLHSQSKVKSKQENTYKHSAETVMDTESLKKFILKEEGFRNAQSDSSLTNHLSFMQWLALKNSLDTLVNSLSNKRKIEKKFKKIWKEKCTDNS